MNKESGTSKDVADKLVMGNKRKTRKHYSADEKIRIVANDSKKSEGALDFRVYAGRAELGAAWKAQTNGDEPWDYLSVQLDDRSFAEPIRAALFEEDGASFFVWNRRDR